MAYRMRRRTTRRRPRRSRAYKPKRSYRRSRRAPMRKTRRGAIANPQGTFYKTWETYQSTTIQLSANDVNAIATFDLSNFRRASACANEFEWYRIRKAVLRIRACQSATSVLPFNTAAKNLGSTAAPDCEPPGFITYYGSGGYGSILTTVESALSQPYAKRHSWYRNGAIARIFKPKTVKQIKMLNATPATPTYSDIDVDTYGQWIKIGTNQSLLEFIGPRIYHPQVENPLSDATDFPRFAVSISALIEFKGIRMPST